MGYSHFWTYRRAFTDREWERLLAAAKHIVAQAEHGLCGAAPLPRRGAPILLAGPRGTLWPLFEHQVIAFNGKRPDHGGSFVLFKEPAGQDAAGQTGDASAGSCETAGRPYDAVVVAVLAAAQAIAPATIEIHCKDGNPANRRTASSDGSIRGRCS